MSWRFWKREAEISCREVVELVNDYLEGALTPAEARRFERHLGDCDGCGSYVEQVRQTIRLSGRLSEETLEPQIRDQLLAAFRDWKQIRGA